MEVLFTILRPDAAGASGGPRTEGGPGFWFGPERRIYEARFGATLNCSSTASHAEGGAVTNYLLEKSDETGQGERNFHVFYQLVQGAPTDERSRLCLLDSAGRAPSASVLRPPRVDGSERTRYGEARADAQ